MGRLVNRIEKEFILNGVIDNEIRLQIHGTHKEGEARLIDFDEEFIEIEMISDTPWTDQEEVRIFFFVKNNMHSFDSKIREKENGDLHLEFPAGVYKNLQRKHERIKNPADITASFTLEGKKVELNFPKTRAFVNVEKPKLTEDYDESNIEDLVESFRSELKKRVSRVRIVMLRNRVPVGFEEELLLKTSKIFWIPSTQLGFPLKDPGIDSPVLTKQDLLQLEEESGIPNSVIKSRLDNYLFEKSKQDIYSEVFCPLLYKEFFVGYIHLQNRMDRKEKIVRDLLDFVFQFSKVLCYSLEITGYFVTEKIADISYEASIIDISASGLLFSLPNKTLSNDLRIRTDIAITLTARNRKMNIGTRIIRKFSDRNQLYLGIQFLDIYPDDYRYMFEVLYGKPFEEEYDDRWEGGIPPPELKLE